MNRLTDGALVCHPPSHHHQPASTQKGRPHSTVVCQSVSFKFEFHFCFTNLTPLTASISAPTGISSNLPVPVPLGFVHFVFCWLNALNVSPHNRPTSLLALQGETARSQRTHTTENSMRYALK